MVLEEKTKRKTKLACVAAGLNRGLVRLQRRVNKAKATFQRLPCSFFVVAQVGAPEKKAGDSDADDEDDSDEDVSENEEAVFRRSHSPATFSAVIGLSCGALVIMIIIVVAMAMRRPRSNNNTKTVLVNTDTEGASEKSHLVNMQENGYENPTYKFYDY